ncbi:ECF-type riboflavin transporter substrate-binding protein [Saccharibacillus sp. CPCC 101409]|uniref:ECF-type riboflavin transporter substrate-binding protein n=1 Tax=Saccharibacillus sp. CPCC 101409 TaxID=3058041 RepID=UPI0026723CF5|nr:ECF-type riboflavin transporter substrate-binding protein [Saccharibacillus sp. CPCC 101409]MDO3411983.1 ECF-type riboflavin transporter substrate-binding protein [Saccharibacillus sp. CPCC 101409]
MRSSKGFSVRTIVAIGIGAALFIVLARFGSIPTGIANTNLQTNYAILALFALLYGPWAGLLIGLIGHTLADLISYGAPWFSWVIASGIAGLLYGLFNRGARIEEGQFGIKEIIRFNIGQIIANAVSWFVAAPVLDILIYAEPGDKVFTQGLVAGGLNILVVAVLGTLLAAAYAKTRTKRGSLTREA